MKYPLDYKALSCQLNLPVTFAYSGYTARHSTTQNAYFVARLRNSAAGQARVRLHLVCLLMTFPKRRPRSATLTSSGKGTSFFAATA